MEVLQRQLEAVLKVTSLRLGDVGIEWEAHVDEGDECGHDVSNMSGLALEALGDVQLWRSDTLLPTEAKMHSEDNDGRDVEESPAEGLEDFELHVVNVSHERHLHLTRFSGGHWNPEQ